MKKIYVKFLYRLANLLTTWGYALHDKALLMDWEKTRDSENQ